MTPLPWEQRDGMGWAGMGPSTVERDGAIVNIASFGKVVARAFNR